MPTPAGDGMNHRQDFRCSSSVRMIPITAPTAVDIFIHDSWAAAAAVRLLPEKSCVTSFANPTHRCDVGLRSCACSPMMPYVSRSNGYMNASASAPTGTAMSCM